MLMRCLLLCDGPISMILDSVAVMLILDFDEKAHGLLRSLFLVSVCRFERDLKEKETIESVFDTGVDDDELHAVQRAVMSVKGRRRICKMP